MILSLLLKGTKHPFWYTVLAGLAIGMLKEEYDRHHHGSPEYADALNTGFGFAVGAGFSYKITF